MGEAHKEPAPARRWTIITLLTFGHGTATREQLRELLEPIGVGLVVDVRRFPGSRRHPHVASAELEQWLPSVGVGYRWEPRLGGRRRIPDGAEDLDPWWKVAAFRAYAAHTRTPEFQAALQVLLEEARSTAPTIRPSAARQSAQQCWPAPSVAVMCSESLWWRCHRRLIADVLVLLHHVEVRHLAHDGRLSEHVPAAGARVSDAGLIYDRTA